MRPSEEKLVTAAIFLIVGMMIFWFFTRHGMERFSFETAAPLSPAEQASRCGQVVRSSCEMVIKERTPECRRAVVEPAIDARLAEPMSDETCKKAQLQLAEGCPPDCLFDYATVVMVPGKVQFDFFEEPDAAKQCFVRARRSVAMQGKCAERFITPPETSAQ